MANLTEDQKEAVRQSWGVIRTKPGDNGAAIFIGLFTAYPEYKALFKDFRELSLEELSAGNRKLRAHGTRFMYGLSSFVDSLDELDLTVEILKKNIDDHYARGIRYQHYENVFGVLPGFLKAKLGDAFDSRTSSAWSTVCTIMLSVIKEHTEELDGLSGTKKDAIRASWALVRTNITQNGVDFFISFFTAHPDYKNAFNDFRDMSLEELATGKNKKLRAHATRVMYSLSSIIDSLDDLDIVVELMKKNVESHVVRGIRYEHYQNLFTVLLAFLREKLGDAFDAPTVAAWTTAADVLLSVTKKHIEELEKRA